jgi:ABC-2 type transport system permease protein
MTATPLRPAREAADVLAAEWIKLRTVRSTYWTMLAAAAITIAVAVMVANNIVTGWPRWEQSLRDTFDPLAASLNGMYVTQLVFGALGVLAIGSEYASGQIRTTFTAVPQRLRILGAKAAAVGATAFAVGGLIAAAAFAVAQRILAERNIDAAFTDPGVLRGLLGAGLFLCVIALIGLGLGAIIRYSAGAVAVLFSLVFILPLVAGALPAPWDTRIEPYLLPELGEQMSALRTVDLTPGTAAAVAVGYVVVTLAVAGVLVVRRDA